MMGKLNGLREVGRTCTEEVPREKLGQLNRFSLTGKKNDLVGRLFDEDVSNFAPILMSSDDQHRLMADKVMKR